VKQIRIARRRPRRETEDESPFWSVALGYRPERDDDDRSGDDNDDN
jgi:hypothetical protein